MWLPGRVSGISGWREQVMAFWRALIYTPPFLSLSSVKRWERWGAASSHSCELHLPGVRGSIVNSDLVPSTMPNYYQHHVIYTSVAGENIALEAVTEKKLCSCRERSAPHSWWTLIYGWFSQPAAVLLWCEKEAVITWVNAQPARSFELKSFLQLHKNYIGNDLQRCHLNNACGQCGQVFQEKSALCDIQTFRAAHRWSWKLQPL